MYKLNDETIEWAKSRATSLGEAWRELSNALDSMDNALAELRGSMLLLAGVPECDMVRSVVESLSETYRSISSVFVDMKIDKDDLNAAIIEYDTGSVN